MPKGEIDKSIWANWQEVEDEGAKNFTLELFEMFLKTSAQDLNDLNEALPKKDYKLIAHLAHALKGSCAQVGALTLSEEFGELETQTRNSSTALSDASFEALQARFLRVRAEIQAECLRRRSLL